MRGRRRRLLLGLSAQVYAAVVSNPLVPNVMTASSFWTPTSKKTGQDTGLNGAPAMTASPTLAGSGYPETAVVGTSYTPEQCITSDLDSDLKYVMFWVTGDTALCGARTLEVNFEGTTQTFNMATDAQWDSVNKRYGVPVAFRPRAGISGLARFRAKGILANGYERVISGDIWFNYPGTTNYFDRHANAIYVSGVDLNGSGSAGTNTATVGTSGNPNDSVQRAVQFASDSGGTREGCYIYIKGNVIDPAAPPGARPTTTLPVDVRPWPGYASNQVLYSGPGRPGGSVNIGINKLVYESLTIDTDSILRFQLNVNSEVGFRNCTFTGTYNGGSSFGFPKGHFASVGGVTSQEWMQYAGGADTFMENCTGTMFAPTGFRRVINCEIVNGWDSFYGIQNSGGRTTGWNYWWAKFSCPPGEQAIARFHSTEELTVNTVVYDPVNDWTKITWTGTPTIVNNTFETHIQVLTGTLAGQEWFAFGNDAVWPLGSSSAFVLDAAAIRGSTALGSFPDANTAYLKGRNLATLGLAGGDLIRVTNVPHKDAMQTSSTSDTFGFIEHGYFQNYGVVAFDPQPALFQQNSAFNTTGITVSVTGTTATFSTAITAKAGHFINIRSGGNVNKYAMITADITASTTAQLDRADLNGTSGATWTLARPVKDFVFENYLVHRQSTEPYHMQFQSPVINVVFLNATIIDPSSSNDMVVLRDTTPGFGARALAFRDCLLGTAKAISATPPTSGIAWDSNHYCIAQTVTDAGASVGLPTYSGTGNVLSGYLPTSANVPTISRVLVPFDAFGRARTVGAKRGAVVA